jgi:dienelactone hydrolase
MTEIVLFHHVQGLTPGVVAFADRLREAGHTVHTPDLFEGQTFASIDDGMSHAQALGDEADARADRAVSDLPEAVVYAGMSFGAMPAQRFAQQRAGALGAVLLHGCADPKWFGGWPSAVPAQIHAMDADPFFVEDGGDIEGAQVLVRAADDAELFLYPGNEHLFTDSSLAAYDAAATDQVVERVLGFLTAR